MKKKIISLLTTAAMAMTVFAVPVFGTQTPTASEESQEVVQEEAVIPETELDILASEIAESEEAIESTEVLATQTTEEQSDALKTTAVGQIEYALPEGGYLHFDAATGTITGCSEDVTTVNIPAAIEGVAVTSIGDRAFSDSNGLTSVTIPVSVVSISKNAFKYCDMLAAISVNAGNAVYTSVDGVLFNKGKTSILYYPQAKAATKYSIPNGVKKISADAFPHACKIKDIVIPASVTNIEIDEYSGCFSGEYINNLKSITVSSANKYYSSKDGVLFNKKKTTLIKYPQAKTTKKYTVPSGVKKISVTSFIECKYLVQLHIPKSVTNIELGNTDSYTRCNFMGCDKFQKFTVSGSNKQYSAKDGVLFNKEKTRLIKYPEGKTNKKYTVPKTVKTVEMVAFIRYGDKNRARYFDIYLPQSVTKIENHMIGCLNPNVRMSIPKSVKKITGSEWGDWFWATFYYEKGSYIDKYLKKLENKDDPFKKDSKLKGKSTLEVKALGKEKVKLRYTAINDATGYQVYVKAPEAKKFTKVKTTSSKSTTLSKLKKGKTYQYKVRAYRTVGDSKIYSTFSAVKKIKVK